MFPKLSNASPIVSLILIFSLGTACTCDRNKGPAAPSNVIKIGEVSSMTGSEATFGISTHRGLEMAMKELNDAGGLRGKKFELVSMDDQGKPEEAATAVTKLITQDKVEAIIGEVASSRSLAMAPIAQNYKIPMLSSASTNPKVTEQGDYIFRICFTDPFQGTVMAKYAAENMKIKRVAILRDIKNDYSVGLSYFFSETFRQKGGEIVGDQTYSSGDIDFKSQLTSIRARDPEAIYIPGYYTEVGLIGRQARELGITVPLMGGDGWDSPKLKEIGGNSLNNGVFSNHYSQENRAENVQAFVTKYKALHGESPDALAALGYDAMKVMADAMTRAKSPSGGDVRDALASTKDFGGVTGKITIDEKRNAIKSAVVLRVEDGDFKFLTTIDP